MTFDSLDYPKYFNLLFFGMLAIGMLFGFLRGLRKSVYHFIVKFIFYVIFFATLGIVVRFMWTVEFNFISNLLSMSGIAGIGDANSFQDAMPIIIETMLGDTINADLSNENFIAFAEGIGLFVLKILYAIVYFTVIQILYRFFTWVVYMVFFKQSKDHVEAHGKKRVPGMAVGLLSGALAVYATLVIFGGVMDVSTNMIALLDATDENTTATETRFTEEENSVMSLSTTPSYLQPLATEPAENDAVTTLREVSESYNSNIVVRGLTAFKLTDDETGRETKFNLYLFDRIFSIDYETQNQKTSVSLRHELAVFTDAAGIFLGSEFSESRDLTDIEADDVENLFGEIADSDLLVSLVPIALDMGAEHFEVDLEVTREDLYDIDYRSELQTLGSIASSAFSLLNTSGLLEENPDYDTITLDGDTTKNIFDDLSESELATLGAYVAMEPMLEEALGASNAVVTVPDGIVWEDEFAAFGEVAKNILDTGITLGDIRSADPLIYVDRLSDMDLTVLLGSRIIEQAMVNVFAGDAGLEGMDMMVAHDDIQWTDTYDGDTIVEEGELRIMLDALNTLADDDALDSLEEFNVNIILSISESTIDALFESEVLSDTLGNFIVDMANDPFIIPTTVLKTITVEGVDRDVVVSTEMKNIFSAVQDLGIEDLTTVDFNPTLLKNLSQDSDDTVLDETKTQNMFASEILHATLSDVLLEQATGTEAVFTIPDQDIDGNDIVVPHSTDAIELVVTDELNAILDAFLALDITDFNNIESIDLTLIKDDFNRLLNSAIIHSTFSDQLLDLTTDETLNVPYYDETDSVEIRKTVSGTEFIIKSELESVVNALDVLNMLDFQSFDGTVDLTVLDSQANRDIVLGSSILQATISKQLIDLDADGTITLPYYDETNTTAIRTMTTSPTPTEYVIKDELDAVIRAMDILDILDIESFTGDVDLSVLADGTNAQDVLESSTIQATVSSQLIDLDSDETITVPYVASDDATNVRFTVGSPSANTDTDYVLASELESLIDALDILGITDVTTFDGSITLTDFYDVGNRNILLASHVMHATMSSQVLDLGAGTLVVPQDDVLGNTVRLTTTSSSIENTEYVVEDELHAMIEALEVLGFTTIDDFSGTLDLNTVYEDQGDDTNQTILLTSASMHATITQQIEDTLGPSILTVPDKDASDNVVRTAQTFVGETNTLNFITKDEIKALINSMEVMGITDITTYDGAFTLANFDTETKQDTLLSSASIHKTFSNELIGLGTEILIVPNIEEDGSTPVRVTNTDSAEFVVKGEIKALINAFDTMGYTDLDSFGTTIDSSEFFTSKETLLLSSSIQATVSEKLLNDTGNMLLVPDQDISGNPVRLQSDTYIESGELTDLLDGLELLGLTDFSAMSFTPANVFNADFNAILESASLHVTISDTILDTAKEDQASAGVGDLIVPVALQETVAVDSLNTDQIEKPELINLLEGLDALGITDFDGSVDAATVTSMDQTTLSTMLDSGSIHVTVDKMIDSNTNISIPNYDDANTYTYDAVNDTLHGITDITLKAEILDFIEAINTATTGDVTNASFDFTSIYAMNETDQAIVFASMIARDTLTPDMVTAYRAATSNPTNDFTASYYHDDKDQAAPDTTYLSETGIAQALDDLQAAGY